MVCLKSCFFLRFLFNILYSKFGSCTTDEISEDRLATEAVPLGTFGSLDLLEQNCRSGASGASDSSRGDAECLGAVHGLRLLLGQLLRPLRDAGAEAGWGGERWRGGGVGWGRTTSLWFTLQSKTRKRVRTAKNAHVPARRNCKPTNPNMPKNRKHPKYTLSSCFCFDAIPPLYGPRFLVSATNQKAWKAPRRESHPELCKG